MLSTEFTRAELPDENQKDYEEVPPVLTLSTNVMQTIRCMMLGNIQEAVKLAMAEALPKASETITPQSEISFEYSSLEAITVSEAEEEPMII